MSTKEFMIAVVIAALMCLVAIPWLLHQEIRHTHQMTYWKDARTGLCYSIFKEGWASSHTLVPCEKIPAGLLTTK